MTTPSAIVVGGGLAGITVARELAMRGWRVTLLERSQRLGGKAGSAVVSECSSDRRADWR
jgi:monoamine oxidase